MTLHKLSAGEGYTYLTRQVAAHDSAERVEAGLSTYYAERGESPGRWVGSGLQGLLLAPGDVLVVRMRDTREPAVTSLPVAQTSSVTGAVLPSLP